MVLLWKLIPAIQSGRFFRRLDWHNYLFIKDKKLFITQNNETKECHLEFEDIIADDWELVDISYQINVIDYVPTDIKKNIIETIRKYEISIDIPHTLIEGEEN